MHVNQHIAVLLQDIRSPALPESRSRSISTLALLLERRNVGSTNTQHYAELLSPKVLDIHLTDEDGRAIVEAFQRELLKSNLTDGDASELAWALGKVSESQAAEVAETLIKCLEAARPRTAEQALKSLAGVLSTTVFTKIAPSLMDRLRAVLPKFESASDPELRKSAEALAKRI